MRLDKTLMNPAGNHCSSENRNNNIVINGRTHNATVSRFSSEVSRDDYMEMYGWK